MSKPKLLCIGHSHLNCVANSIEGRRKHVPGFDDRYDIEVLQLRRDPFHPNFVQVDGERRIAPRCSAALAERIEKFRPDAILGMINGQEYQVISIVNHPVRYDFALPGSDEWFDDTAELVPHAVIRAELTRLTQLAVTIFVDELKRLTDCPFYLVTPPPPIPDENHILAYPGPFAEQAKTFGISPAPFRRKMWRLYRDILRQEGTKSGALVLDPPRVSMEDDYLAPDYWPKDPIHGNLKYGHAVFDMVTRRAFPEPVKG